MGQLHFRPVDAFHASIGVAIKGAGYGVESHLGCASGRAFGVVTTSDPFAWLQPGLTPEAQVRLVMDRMGLHSHLTVASVSELERWLSCGSGILVGPLRRRLLVPHAEQAYFYGQSLWAYVWLRGSQVIASDTLGCPEVLVTSEDVQSSVDAVLGRLYVVHPGGDQQLIPWRTVLRDGFKNEESVESEFIRAVPSTLRPLSVRLGIRWYLGEIVSVLNLLSDLTGLPCPELDDIEDYLSGLGKVRTSQDLEAFSTLRLGLWRRLQALPLVKEHLT